MDENVRRFEGRRTQSSTAALIDWRRGLPCRAPDCRRVFYLGGSVDDIRRAALDRDEHELDDHGLIWQELIGDPRLRRARFGRIE